MNGVGVGWQRGGGRLNSLHKMQGRSNPSIFKFKVNRQIITTHFIERIRVKDVFINNFPYDKTSQKVY